MATVVHASQALAANDLVAAAELETGQRGMTDSGLRQRLGQLVDWINERGPYDRAQLDPMRRQLQQLLVTRLRIAADRRRIPAIAAEAIERPIFVIGFPRSGTTLLHSLLAEDPAVHAPRAWHSHAPSPPPGEAPVCRGRLEIADRKVKQLLDFVPGLLPLHPYWDRYSQALIEDEELFTLDLRNAYPTWLYHVPTLSVMVQIGGNDAAATYDFHHQMLQHLQWNTGRRRWAVKGVGHQFLLDAIFAQYPDAICVWPHRDPVDNQASMFSIAAVLFEAINPGGTDWHEFARTSTQAVSAGLQQVLNSPVIDDPRLIHLPFSALVSRPVETVQAIYERAQLPVTEQFEARMRAWLSDAENRSDRYGRYDYSYEPFGLDPAWVRSQFQQYRERFCSTTHAAT